MGFTGGMTMINVIAVIQAVLAVAVAATALQIGATLTAGHQLASLTAVSATP
jgi:hypothetical protein